MIDEVLYEIGKLKWTMVIDFTIVLLLCAYLSIMTRKFSWKRSKVRVFAILYNLTEAEAICTGLIIARFCFVLTNVLYPVNIGWGHLVVFVIFSLLILIMGRRPKQFFVDIATYSIIFLLLYILMSLLEFYKSVNTYWLIITMVAMMGIFIVTFSLQQAISSYEVIMKMHRNEIPELDKNIQNIQKEVKLNRK